MHSPLEIVPVIGLIIILASFGLGVDRENDERKWHLPNPWKGVLFFGVVVLIAGLVLMPKDVFRGW